MLPPAFRGPPWTWLDTSGHQHSDELHVVERFRRTPDTTEYEYTLEDQKMYAKPWTLSRVFKPLKLTPDLPSRERGDCGFDIRHNLTFKLVYRLPFYGNRVVEPWHLKLSRHGVPEYRFQSTSGMIAPNYLVPYGAS